MAAKKRVPGAVMDALPARDDSAQEGGGRGENKLLKIGGIVAVGIFMLWFFVNSDEPAQRPAPAPAQPQVPTTFDTSSLAGEAAEQERQLEVEAMLRRIAELEAKQRAIESENRRELAGIENRLTREVNEVAKAVEDALDAQVRNDRLAGRRGIEGAVPPSSTEFGDFAMEGEFSAEPAPPAFPYQPLGQTTVAQNNVNGMDFGGSNDFGNPQASAQNGQNRGTDSPGGEEAEPTALRRREPSSGVVNTTIAIPAYSFTDLTLLHGVSCPVTSSLLSGAGIAAQPAPIVMPVTSGFRGPQGTRVDIGKPHLIGFCEGVDRRRPTGLIKVEGLSYVKANGETEIEPVSGYIIDSRDNDLGVKGTKESVKGGQLALSVVANMSAAIGDVFGQSGFDQIETQGGNIREVLRSGKLGTAAAGRAVSGAANSLANILREAADQKFDVIHLEGGTPVQLVTEEIIEIEVGGAALSESRNAKPLL